MRRKSGRPKRTASRIVLVDFAGDAARIAAIEQGIPGAPIRNARGRIKGLELDFSRDQPGSLVLGVPGHVRTGDWRNWTTLTLELGNRGTAELTVGVSLHTVPGSITEGKGVRFTAEMPAGSRAKWRIPLLSLRYTNGWETPWAWARQPGLGNLLFEGRTDTGNIVELRIFPHPAGSEGRLSLYRLVLSGRIKPEKWIDRFGQRFDMTWPGKVRSDADIREADKKDMKAMRGFRSPSSRDKFQAWTARAARRATGFFRTEEIDGRWWFVAPNGNLFYSTGMDAVVTASHARLDPMVRAAYSWLPPRKGRFRAAWSSRRGTEFVSFNVANNIRKWGAREFESRSREKAIARQLYWGFTSFGNWTQKELFSTRKLPYFSVGPDFSRITVPYVGKLLHDVYHPDFEQSARLSAGHLAQYRDDPWLVGHFVSNEVGWSDLPRRVLALPADRPAKAAMASYLKSRYADISALNRAWGTSAVSFEDLSSLPESGPNDRKETADRDLAGFRGEFAELWYGIWAAAVREADPNHLVLGSRINQGQVFPEVVQAAAKFMDVVSFNHYFHAPAKDEFDSLYALAKKPFLVGEYAHNTTASGLLTTAVPVANERERGVGYRCYTEQLAALPYFIGGHYFQYLDEPITGRFDRENAFNGFVNVADTPYPHLVRCARETNFRIYEIHAGLTPPFEQQPRR